MLTECTTQVSQLNTDREQIIQNVIIRHIPFDRGINSSDAFVVYCHAATETAHSSRHLLGQDMALHDLIQFSPTP